MGVELLKEGHQLFGLAADPGKELGPEHLGIRTTAAIVQPHGPRGYLERTGKELTRTQVTELGQENLEIVGAKALHIMDE
ncbi:hypothetical protein ES703_120911 [subsurface metagenome]